MTQLISNIHVYQTGKWPKDFTEVTVIDLKKPKIQNAATIKHDQPHRTYSQDSSKDTQKRDKIKTEVVLGDLFGFRRGKGSRDATGMLKIISE
jgi:hypothetical protein